ncbi:MAG: Gfo/Idh/MocA family oxidoreductase [Alphaproteobacteria bacterium]|nr:Gfo/Idh/MocA family oxidoreductase [Alphaproteobacteria bacterium]
MKSGTFSDPLKVAVIGAGYFAQFHHDAWRRIPRADLTAVADRDIAKARATGASAFDDPARMLQSVRPDLVDIATPPDTHLDMIRLALDSGVRAIICQKPFCGAIDAAQEAVRLAEAAEATVVVHENFRFQPWYRTARRLLREGRIGTVMQASFRMRPGDGQGPEAYLARQPYFQQMPRFLVHETAIHWVDTFRFLLGGEPSWVFADLLRRNPAIAGEDSGSILFGFEDGVRALYDGNRLLDHPAENRRLTMGEMSLEGDRGELRLSGDGALHIRAFGENNWTLVAAPPESAGFGGDCVHALQSHVVDGLLEGTEIENRAGSYLRNIAIESAIYESADLGRKVYLTQ